MKKNRKELEFFTLIHLLFQMDTNTVIVLRGLQQNGVHYSGVPERAPSNTPCYAFLSICTVTPLRESIPNAKAIVLVH